MAELSNKTGIGQDGYIQVQKEVTYGTAVTGSETFLPIKFGSLFKGHPEIIENNDMIASRLKQDPNKGRLIRRGTIDMSMWPTLIGMLAELHLGASSDAAVGDGAYTHTWLAPTSGVNTGTSWTVHQAVGASVADQFDGVKSDVMVIRSDTSGNCEMSIECIGQGLTEDVARETTFSYPANATNPPLNFSNASITLTDSGGSDTILVCANSFEISLPLNHDLERFKICSSASAEISEPVFNAIPGCTISMNIDADRYMITRARDFTKMSLDISITSVLSQAGSTPTYHSFALEIPGVRLAPDTEIPTTEDRTQMDVTFECGYGGTTTGSGAANVMYEMRIVDATAAYAG
jgi:hypothetical protein